MYRVVFWNVNKKDLRAHVCSIAATMKADAIVLNENSIAAADTLTALQSQVSADFFLPECDFGQAVSLFLSHGYHGPIGGA